MKIGALTFDVPLILAPMAGYTDLVTRIMAREQGCGLVMTEMVSAKGLLQNSRRTLRYLATSPLEAPLSVQIFGADPTGMARAAAMAQERGAGLIDINMGCPVGKVVKAGAGAALMRNPAAVRAVLSEVRRAVSCPVTVKIRAGWNLREMNGVEIACLAQDSGADGVAVHGRTVAQGFEGTADWDVIREIKRRVSIPVIGNGDVKSPDDVIRMLEYTGCDGVMIGRASLGNPWIFSQCRDVLENRVPHSPSLEERYEMILRRIELTAEYLPEKLVASKLRHQIILYVKGLHDSSCFRNRAQETTTLEELRETLSDYFSSLNRSDSLHES